jgi:hypothetical protein
MLTSDRELAVTAAGRGSALVEDLPCAERGARCFAAACLRRWDRAPPVHLVAPGKTNHGPSRLRSWVLTGGVTNGRCTGCQDGGGRRSESHMKQGTAWDHDLSQCALATSTAYTCEAPCMFERNTTHLPSGVNVALGSSSYRCAAMLTRRCACKTPGWINSL